MSLTISSNPRLPPLHRKLHKTAKPQACQNSIFSKPHFCAISTLKNTNIRVSPSFAVNQSLFFDNSAYPFGKDHDFVPKVQSFLVSSFSQLGCLVSDDKTFDAVENHFHGMFKVTMWWALIDLIGSLWPCSVQEGYVFSMGSHAVQIVPTLSMPGPLNMNVRNSRLTVSAFKNSDSRLPKKEEQKMMHEGLITESLPNGMFRVRLDNEDMIIGYISGKMRKNFIRILPGDRVKVEVSRYDSTRGRIVLRLRNKSSTE